MRYGMVFLIILGFIIAGCSGGGNNPLTPQSDQTAGSIDSLPIIGASIFEDGSFNALGMLGAYEMSINPQNNTAELVSKRTSAIGESYVVSGIGFFTISPCSTCLKMKSIELDINGNIIVSFLISHPFKKGDTLKPPSAINRLDLDVFDLALVVYPKDATADTFSFTGTSAYTGICIAADGYTAELDQVANDSAALPYFLVIDDSIGGTGTFNKFEMGVEDIEFSTAFDLAAGSFNFDLYITMGYGWSAKKPDRLAPMYYNPEFNRKAAWKVDVTPPSESWPAGDGATARDVVVEVYDWQIGANVDPLLTNTDDIYAASGVSSVSVEIPGMNSALPTMNTADSGLGTPDDPLVYTFAIANENLLVEGDYFGLVKVTDERAVGSIGDRDYIIDSPDGILLEYFNLPEFATFQLFKAIVEGATGEACFTVDIHNYFDGYGPDGTDDNPVPTEWLIDFDASCSTGATTYDWDIDGDGTYEIEGLTDPIYIAGYPAGTAPGTYYPVLRINGSDAMTFTYTSGITIKTGVYVDGATGTGTGPGDLLNPFNTIVNGVAGTITPGTSILMVRGDNGSGGQQIYNERIDLIQAHNGIHIQGYSLDDTNSQPPAMRDFTPPYRIDGSNYRTECLYVNNANDVQIDGFEFDNIRGTNTPGGHWDEHVRVIYFIDSNNIRVSHTYCHNIITYSSYWGWKPGYNIYLNNCNGATITNNLMCDCVIAADWGTIDWLYARECNELLVANNTVDQVNEGPWLWAWWVASTHGVNLHLSDAAEIYNMLITNLTGVRISESYGGGGWGALGSGNTNPVFDYCDVWTIRKASGNPNNPTYTPFRRFDGDITEGAHCINPGPPTGDFGSDPLYENGHHLQVGSPCIDTGHIDEVYNDADSSRSDIGCYGGPGGYWNFED